MQSLTDQFLTFCRSKPADETYSFWSLDRCACAQFAEALGWPGYNDANKSQRELRAAIGQKWNLLAFPEPRTFGALADRLEAANAKGLAR